MWSLISGIKKSIRIKVYAPHNNRIYLIFKGKKFTLLDVGCSGSSVFFYKTILPKIEYHGIDYKNPLVTEKVLDKIDRFYEIDLQTLEFSKIPDSYFDCVVMSHVI